MPQHKEKIFNGLQISQLIRVAEAKYFEYFISIASNPGSCAYGDMSGCKKAGYGWLIVVTDEHADSFIGEIYPVENEKDSYYFRFRDKTDFLHPEGRDKIKIEIMGYLEQLVNESRENK